jgi:hypothetical protein
MSMARPAALALVSLTLTLLPAAGCSGEGPNGSPAAAADTGEYVVERSAADGVETVRTVSGSRWGGNPRLVEELAIGEEVGDDPYLFGSISAAWATEERIYVIDAQIPAVRVFDHQGNYLHQAGGVGQGPGEYSRPIGLAVTDDGRVLVLDVQGARLIIFGADGERIDDWSLGSPQAALGLQLTDAGDIYTRVIAMPSEVTGGPIEIQETMQQIDSEGRVGDPIRPPEMEWEPPTVEVEAGGNSFDMALLPFTPSYEWTFAPGGEMIAGVGNEYRFEIHAPDGGVTVVEKEWTPVPVNDGERAFRARMAVNNVRQMAPDFRIPPSDVPDHKAAFTRLIPDRSGRVWVTRQGPSELDPDCREMAGGAGMAIMIGASGESTVTMDPGAEAEYEEECWMNTHVFDVFEIATGEFLGSVPAPEPGFTTIRFADGDTVLASVTDELGTVRLKKYRLVID